MAGPAASAIPSARQCFAGGGGAKEQGMSPRARNIALTGWTIHSRAPAGTTKAGQKRTPRASVQRNAAIVKSATMAAKVEGYGRTKARLRRWKKLLNSQ